MGTGDLRMTFATRAVLAAFMQDPTGEHYGLSLAEVAQLSSGSLYPVLARLEEAGLVTSRWENVDASAVGRPRRRYYKLTPSGRQMAAAAVVEGRTKARVFLEPA